ncbi:hypothetical protein POTOM_041865 [Populus tomentosa]|uniref:Uncharacterized protein n=1 Tax=Populus tomentosa TaxID=118781 RepID=A0A8X7YZC7_POPTO|nr:hypothetical protein POTOM_041865 [Populus tomentosa]
MFLRNFWRSHRSKILITAGVLGSGYFLYRLYNAREQRLADMERELARQRANDELIKAQLQVHFENVQLIADTTTLPHAMQYLRSRIAEELDLSQLTERLQKGKGKPYTLTSSEKLELWDRLKILSFTQMVVSLWAVTILSLFIKVQVNILGRHLYIDTARGLGSSLLLAGIMAGLSAIVAGAVAENGDRISCSPCVCIPPLPIQMKKNRFNDSASNGSSACHSVIFMLPQPEQCQNGDTFSVIQLSMEENVDLIDRDDQQKFLAGADFLANNGLLALISNIQAVVTEVIEGKKLIDLFNTTSFHETVMQILDKFMSVGSLHQWIDYLMPEDRGHYKLGTSSSIDDTVLPNSTNFDQLMVEARTVLSSAEFGKIMGISLKVAVDALVEDMEAQCQSTGASLTSGMPLAKLLSRVIQIVPSLLREASQNQFIQIIRTVPEVELFFTLLYANNLVD